MTFQIIFFRSCFSTLQAASPPNVSFPSRLDDGALGSFHGSRRVTQFLQWAARAHRRRSTLDFDERVAVQKRIGEGADCVVFTLACGVAQPVAAKLAAPAGGVLGARSCRPQGGGAPARSAAAQEHRRLSRHLGRARADASWRRSGSARFVGAGQVGVCLSVAPPFGLRFLHTSTIVHRDIKPANLLVFSLLSSKTVVAKLTDLSSAR
jgi:hypothetical protein